ncbi:MAG: thioredoxin domain-containing protein [Bacteroidota bacterium]
MPTLLRPLAVALLLGAALAPQTASATPTEADEPKVLALLFAADWCGSCKILDPKLTAARAGLADEPVQFVTLDHTDADARAAAAATAREGGYADLYAEYAGKTGFVLLVDAESFEVIDRITKDDSEVHIRQKVRRALATA